MQVLLNTFEPRVQLGKPKSTLGHLPSNVGPAARELDIREDMVEPTADAIPVVGTANAGLQLATKICLGDPAI